MSSRELKLTARQLRSNSAIFESRVPKYLVPFRHISKNGTRFWDKQSPLTTLPPLKVGKTYSSCSPWNSEPRVKIWAKSEILDFRSFFGHFFVILTMCRRQILSCFIEITKTPKSTKLTKSTNNIYEPGVTLDAESDGANEKIEKSTCVGVTAFWLVNFPTSLMYMLERSYWYESTPNFTLSLKI